MAPRVLALAVLFAALAPSQTSLTGVVYERVDDKLVPLGDAHVCVRDPSDPYALAYARTDGKGRYELARLPAARVEVSLDSRLYTTVEAGGVATDAVTRSCSEQGDCGPIDLVVEPNGAIEGRVVDRFGDPVPGIYFEARPVDPARGRRGGSAASDDRGRFRLWGLRPGRYRLEGRHHGSRLVGMPQGPVIEAREVEIPGPGRTAELHLTIGAERESHRLAGRVVEAPEGDARDWAIALSPLEETGGGRYTRTVQSEDLAFDFGRLAAGEYLLHLRRPGDRSTRLLGVVRLDRDLENLELRVQPPTGVAGTIGFDGEPPERIFLAFAPPGQRRLSWPAEVDPATGAFRQEGLPPGEYQIRLVASDYYLLDPPERIRVELGVVRELELRATSQRGAVRGRIRLGAGDDPAAHFLVGLRGPEAARRAQTDDRGGFAFERLPAGDYEVAAWRDLQTNLDDPAAWERAGENVRKFTLEPGFEVELDLTVTAP